MLLLAAVRRVNGEMIELVSVLEAGGAEALGERAIGIVHFDHLFFGVMRAGPSAHHLCKFGPVVVGKRDRVVAADTAAFADKAEDSLTHFRIVVDHAADVIEPDRIEFLDLRILQEVQIVAESGCEGARIFYPSAPASSCRAE